VSAWTHKFDPFREIRTAQVLDSKMPKRAVDVSQDKKLDLFEEMEPKIRQRIKVVGRTIFCFRCDGSKELAGYYCGCGSFMCALHLAEHSCLVSSSMQYNQELLQALS
jgi:hypothetical protein